MLEGQVQGGQEQPLPSKQFFVPRVDIIPQDGMPNARHVASQLMRASRYRLQINRCEPINVEAPGMFYRSPVGQRFLAIQRRIDRATALDTPRDESSVPFVDPTLRKHRQHGKPGLNGSGTDQETRGFVVETVARIRHR